MSQPYVGEIRIFAGNFAPVGWAFCDGSLQSISQNTTLFQLIGTTYGGDGVNTFALPDLRSRVPIHQGVSNYGYSFAIGQNGGEEIVALTTNQIPAHSHPPAAALNASGNPVNSPAGSVWSGWTGGQFDTTAPSVNMSSAAAASSGGSQPHDNMVPFLAVNFIISFFGVFPSQT